MDFSRPTQSICPNCGKPVPASYAIRAESVFFDISCPDCGFFSSLLSERREDFEFWMGFEPVTVAPAKAVTEGSPYSECPLHCGLCENHLMTACCVLLDVTDRCNQNCPYCFARSVPETCITAECDPPLAVIERWYDRLLDLGEERPFNIQLSGGEPTVREDLPAIIAMGRAKGFEYIQLNTNGRRLAEEGAYCGRLKEAGLSTVFLQFDGTEDPINMTLRGEPLFGLKRRAIENCGEAGLPVTIVPTVVRGVNLLNIGEMINFMLENIHVVKGVHFQPVSLFGRYPEEAGACGDEGPSSRVTMFSVMEQIEAQTKGRIRREDLRPITTGHPLCCFCGSFLLEADGSVSSLMSDETRSSGASCCEPAPGSGCKGPAFDPLEVIRRDRDFVLNKWKVGKAPPGGPTHGTGPLSLDEAAEYFRANQFTVSGMAFMDGGNLDAERLKRCRVQVFTRDEKLIPFCAYNSIFRV